MNNAENKVFESVLLTWKKHICKSQSLYKRFSTADIQTAENTRCPASEKEEGDRKFDILVFLYLICLYILGVVHSLLFDYINKNVLFQKPNGMCLGCF